MNFRYGVPTEIHWGEVAELGPMLAGSRPFIVRGFGTLDRPPLAGRLDAILQGLEVRIGTPVGANPTLAEVRTLVAEMREFGADVIVGIGGGSPIDAAKAAALVVSSGGDPADYFLGGKPIARPMLPLIAVPTTAGTGTEVTPYAIIVDEQTRRKLSYLAGKLYPNKALIDPTLTYTMSAYVSACTGMDAFCHALESIWAKRANPISTLLAGEALRLILAHLPKAVRGEHPSRDAMMRASLLAGLAFSNAGLTAIHPASYPLTTRFEIPHGHACSLFLLPVVEFNWPVLAGVQQALLRDIFGGADLPGLLGRMEALMQASGLETRFTPMGVTAADIATLADNGLGSSTLNNPRDVTRDDIARMIAARL